MQDNTTPIRILCIGDVVGATGRAMFQKHIARVKAEHKIDAVVVNGENSSDKGRGITSRIVRAFKQSGVDVVTSGNHIWANKEIFEFISQSRDLIRPANFPSGAPGFGYSTFTCKGYTVAVINLQGRVFMKELLDCPFRAVESILTYLQDKTNIIIIDFHAETSAEKQCFAYFVDGKVSGVVGTHTHVPTADERILPKGTAYATDLGMTGAVNSLIGMKKDPIIKSMISQLPVKFEVEQQGPFFMTGVIIDVNPVTGKAVKIERIRVVDDALQLPTEPDGSNSK